MSHPLHLPHGTSADQFDRVVITAESAGWAFCGLRIVELPRGGSRTLNTGPDEVLILPLAGSVTVACGGETLELAGRPDVFSGPTDFAYLPISVDATISSRSGARFAIPSAHAQQSLPPSYGAADNVPVEIRGAGAATRQLNNFCAPESFPTAKLITVECITPAGNWSSWPPHKHDTTGPDEAVLEEIYYFEVAPAKT